MINVLSFLIGSTDNIEGFITKNDLRIGFWLMITGFIGRELYAIAKSSINKTGKRITNLEESNQQIIDSQRTLALKIDHLVYLTELKESETDRRLKNVERFV